MIRVLSGEIVDRIAAGEVVERPAAVVKELVENALDAGAERITVDLEEGGRRQVRVEDDGDGIAREDMEKLFLRHATSKLADVEDLFHIASLGFRGEALASIGAVSRTRVLSRPPGADEGTLVENEGGRLSPPRPAACPPGTTVEVRDLFFNVPARRKFLKTKATELAHCVEWITRFALSYRHVAFLLRQAGREVFRAEAAASLLDRITLILGRDAARDMLPVDREALGLRLEGVLGRPGLGRRDMRRSYLFLNGRFVRDRAVHAAIRRAYREVLPEKFHPAYCLGLHMPPEWVDVNVHPTKTEVRFRDGARVFSAVHRMVTGILAGEERFGAISGVRFEGNASSGSKGVVAEAGPGGAPFPLPVGSAPARRAPPPLPSPSPASKAPARESLRGTLLPARPAGSAPARVLTVHDTFAVVETPEGMAILDPHALHERLLYERLRREYRAGGVRLQRLLLPVTVELDRERAARMDELCFDLNHLGIRAEPFGPRTLRVTAVPALLKHADPAGLVEAVLDRVEDGSGGEAVYLERLHRLACRGAVKAGRRLSEEEVRTLLREAADLDFSGRCPHGRPTLVRFTLAELETLFKRRGF